LFCQFFVAKWPDMSFPIHQQSDFERERKRERKKERERELEREKERIQVFL
jgi:hypothetical protein